MKVGFIGLGGMGAGMSHNLIKAGRLCMYYLYVQFEFRCDEE